MRGLGTILAGACALVLVAAASGATRADPGVDSASVKIGGTVPLSGVAAAYASVGRGADAYFKYVNDTKGGVNGRKIDYTYLDDAYDPSQTVEQTRRLVQQDKVFAVVNSLGTEHSLAVRAFLNQSKVPQLFVATGATTFGRDYKQYPWSIGFLPSYTAEGVIYGKYVRANLKQAKIAVLYQDDDYGKELLAGLKKGLGPLKARVVSAKGYDPTASDVNSQIASLKASKDPTVKLYKQIMKKYAPSGDPTDVYHMYSMAVAYTFVDALKHAGNPPTRDGIMRAVTHLNEVNPFLLKGITVKTSPTDHFPVQAAQLQVWRGGSWHLVGKPVSARG